MSASPRLRKRRLAIPARAPAASVPPSTASRWPHGDRRHGVAAATARPRRPRLDRLRAPPPACGAGAAFPRHVGRNHGFHTGPTFVVASALVLPPTLVVALAVPLHVPTGEGAEPWYLQAFNIANYLLSALAAWVVAPRSPTRATSGSRSPASRGRGLRHVNHLLLAVMLLLGRGHSFRESGLFSPPGSAWTSSSAGSASPWPHSRTLIRGSFPS